MSSLKPVRGTHDILPGDLRRHRHVENAAFETAGRYGFEEISTPIFEFTEVFSRTLGDTSDIVTKEMYTFADKGDDLITLRPEGTAGIARAFISSGLSHQLPLKFFYRGPMFRYERPQKGRQRQFHQVGVELLGVDSPLADVEVISIASDFLSALGVDGKVVCELNSLGDSDSRSAYRQTLVDYLMDHINSLSEDSRARLDRNPLRILDSKDKGDRAIIADAPLITDCLNDPSKRFFDELLEGLEISGVAYTLNPKLVRGLDYYCHTAFEFTTDALGAQGALVAGGRYDGLIKQMGGPQTPGTGWAAGVERLALMIDDPIGKKRPIAMIPIGNEAAELVLRLTQELRRAGHTIDLGYAGNMKKRMQRANKISACAAVIIGEDELSKNAVVVRDMDSGEQTEIPLSTLEDFLSRFL
ncbi:MAG: histidine--tRNA ligase [Rhodospirillales bacterium]|nr:histidine--tRNA ligase [Rhodospirillales bacterium]